MVVIIVIYSYQKIESTIKYLYLIFDREDQRKKSAHASLLLRPGTVIIIHFLQYKNTVHRAALKIRPGPRLLSNYKVNL